MHRRLISIVMMGSMATVLMERGLYFFTKSELGFGPIQNLLLGLAFGACYGLAAFFSHRLAERFGEKKLIVFTVVTLSVIQAALAIYPHPWLLSVGFAVIGGMIGLFWPIIESYVHAGYGHDHTLKVVGRFNLAWSSMVFVGLAITGPLLASGISTLLIWVSVPFQIFVLLLVRALPSKPPHMEEDHPDRGDPVVLKRYVPLLSSSRWTMSVTYILLFLIAPLMPTILNRLTLPISWEPGLSGVLDLVRFATFGVLGVWTRWHGKKWPLWGAAILAPIGFGMILFGNHLSVLLAGEVLFGLAAGTSYYAALYYAMVVSNASVDAGGMHEALIGAGFTVGPAIGLLGYGLAGTLGGFVPGMLIGVGPVVIFCMAGAAVQLRKA